MIIKSMHRIVFLFLVLLASACSSAIANTAIEPKPKGNWILRHLQMVDRARQGDIDVVLLGDSITDYWPKRAPEVYEHTFGAYKTANFGISADRTQHLLWRLQNGIGEGYSPKVTVLLIGTNNTGMEKDGTTPRNSTAETIEGILQVIEEIRTRFPDTTLLLFALFPRGTADNFQRDQIREINSALSRLHNGKSIRYIDIGDQFLDPDGEIPESLMPDKLHPAPDGYKIWAAALEEPLSQLLKQD